MTLAELVSEIRELTDTDSVSYPDASVARRINSAQDIMVGKIIEVCRSYPYDDENFANIAEGTLDLDEGVSKYTITDRFLTISEVKIKDVGGTWHIVSPETQVEDGEIVETQEAQTGLPTKYRIVGRTIFLRKAPTASSVTLTAGLLIKYTRASYQVTTSDITTGTLVLGLASPWHITIAKMAALPYNKLYHQDRVTQMERDISVETKDCVDFYAGRLKDRINRLTPSRHSNK